MKKNPTKQPMRAPEWITWESVLGELAPWGVALFEDNALTYLDHTDSSLVLVCTKPWAVRCERADDLLDENTKLGIDCALSNLELGFRHIRYARTAAEWVLDYGFYQGRKWRTCRYATLLQQGNWCRACGARPPEVELHVDHIVPRSIDPSKAWDLSNLQVLCRDCNLGKGNGDSMDWRPSARVVSK